MNKFHIVKQLRANGDSILTLRNEQSILATTDFSARYIKRKKSQRFTIQKDCILLFSWTDDGFKNIKVNEIRQITPLSAVLKNPSPEIKIDA
jgi:hypothetical protein